MLPAIPLYVSILFMLTTVATLLLFYWSLQRADTLATQQKAGSITLILTVWLVLQGIVAVKNVYSTHLNFLPPKIVLFGVLPLFVTMALLFILPGGRRFIDALPLKQITWLHIIRIPVEITLFLLFTHGAIPEVMTFEGRNFDIVCGLTAPIIALFGFHGKQPKRSLLLLWNIVCLLLLVNIIFHAFFSAPTPLQKFGFDQPNIGILYFPFNWLPAFVAPLVLFMHLVAIKKLSR